MRRWLALLLFPIPIATYAIPPDAARHLLARTGFEVSAEAVARLEPLSYEAAVGQLLDGVHREPLTPAPGWINETPPEPRQLRELSQAERKQLQMQVREHAIELKGWWYREMLATDSPLTERLTLFWHNHFTSSLRKVKWPPYLYRQNLLLRRKALGNFAELLHAIARDPAMLVYLDGQQNHRDKPNENFARELLELFTLGEGQYTEADIKQGARAFTGWMVNRQNGEFIVNHRQHDDGDKTFLGHRGRFDGDDIIDIILDQPRTAEFITEKLWREFVSDTPDPQEVKRLARVFRDAHYEIRPLLYALLTAPAFRDPQQRGTLVKSPVELVIGTVRQFQVPVAEDRNLARAGILLGQDLFDPPNVKGWAGGAAWITSSSLLARYQVLERILRGAEMSTKGKVMNPTEAGNPETLKPLLLPLPPVNAPSGATGAALVRAWVLDPVYQLK